MDTMNISYLCSISTIIESICESLEPHDIFNLAYTCKYLYSYCMAYINIHSIKSKKILNLDKLHFFDSEIKYNYPCIFSYNVDFVKRNIQCFSDTCVVNFTLVREGYKLVDLPFFDSSNQSENYRCKVEYDKYHINYIKSSINFKQIHTASSNIVVDNIHQYLDIKNIVQHKNICLCSIGCDIDFNFSIINGVIYTQSIRLHKLEDINKYKVEALKKISDTCIYLIAPSIDIIFDKYNYNYTGPENCKYIKHICVNAYSSNFLNIYPDVLVNIETLSFKLVKYTGYSIKPIVHTKKSLLITCSKQKFSYIDYIESDDYDYD